MVEALGVLVSGLAAGTLGGLLGIGGGIILVPFLRFCVGLSPAQAAGTCVVAVFCTTLSGSYRHHKLGHVNIKSTLPVIAAGVVATSVFSILFLWAAKQEHWLDLGTGLVFSLISARMILEGLFDARRKTARQVDTNQIRGPLLHKVAIGTAGGVLPGLLGIGTGGIMVPAFTLILKAPIKTAVGCSLTCFSANALISSAFKFSQGFVNLAVAGPACAGTLVGAYLGATLNRKFPPAALKIIFGVTFAYVSLKFILSFRGIGI
ncbi:MAG: sulfite exporter TauE/SafE family protein [Phycisphaerae bacterium]|nr:sulfite exporter TauE/SafE family protein [Phycisphaerae bacterium]